MANAISDLTAPSLIVAMPQVLDPFFHRSVVLLTAHEDDGSQGFVINRPTDLQIDRILEDMEIDWNGGADVPAFMGGPVHPQVGTILYLDEVPLYEDESIEIVPGLYCTQSIEVLRAFANSPPPQMRLVLGYAGWRPGQLLEEVQRHDWITAPLSSDFVFSNDPDEVWEKAVHSAGMDPSALPNWTDDAGGAN